MSKVMQIGRFLISGIIGVSVNLTSLHVLAGIFHIYYLVASIMAISISTVVGFLLQKYWTFQGASTLRTRTQFAFYALVVVVNIAINTAIVFVLTGILSIHYLIAQFIGAGVVAVSSYLIYQKFIFTRV